MTNTSSNRNATVEVDAGNYALHVRYSGRAVAGSNLVNFLVGGLATNALAVGGDGGVVVESDSGAGGAIGTDGDAMIATYDQSIIVHSDEAV